VRQFVGERAMRLLVPFLAGVVLLVPLQIYVERRVTEGYDGTYLQSLQQFLDVHLSLDFPMPVTGTWFDPAHLWFIAYLFSFTLLLLPGLLWLRGRPRLPLLSTRGAAAIWAIAILGVAGAEGILGTETAGGWNRWTYLVLLGLGVALAIQPAIGAMVARRWRTIFVAALGSFVALALTNHLLEAQVTGSVATSMDLSAVLWRAGKGVTVLLFLMAVVGSLVDRVPALTSQPRGSHAATFFGYVQPIALPLYIVHQTILVLLAYWIVSWSVPMAAQWVTLVTLTLALSTAIVEVGRRTRSGRLMLGMKTRDARTAPASPRLLPEPGVEAEFAPTKL
jgi:hypothetical protein